MQTELGQDANAVIIEILESYMEFVDIFEQTIKNKFFGTSEILKAKPYMEMLIAQKRTNWKPILEKAKQEQTKGGNK